MERCGSIKSLLDKTPEIEVKIKLHSEKMIKDSQIFVPDKQRKRRIRTSYDHNLDSKDPLNFKTPEIKPYDLLSQKLYILILFFSFQKTKFKLILINKIN